MVCGFTYDAGPKPENGGDENEVGEGEKDGGGNEGIIKLTKAERRAKLKKSKKEAKKEGKKLSKPEEAEEAPQVAVLVLFSCFWISIDHFNIFLPPSM